MNAELTARRVLTWAISPVGPPPNGSLREAAALASPEPATRELVGELARRTAARMGAGAPPFGDPAPIGCGAVLLAAAVGGRQQPGQARQLAEAVRPARTGRSAGWYDLVARHGLVDAVLSAPLEAAKADQEPLAETLLEASTLSAILHRPPLRRLTARTTATEVTAAEALLGLPRGPEVLAAGLAPWSSQHTVLAWRLELLTRLAPDYPDLLLDTYTLARLRHGPDWDLRLTWARRQLSLPGPPDRLAIATAAFWSPLARFVQRGTLLSGVRPLLDGHQPALQLVQRHRLTTTGTL